MRGDEEFVRTVVGNLKNAGLKPEDAEIPVSKIRTAIMAYWNIITPSSVRNRMEWLVAKGWIAPSAVPGRFKLTEKATGLA